MTRGEHNRVWMWVFLAAALLLATTRWYSPSRSGGLKPVANRTAMPDVVLPQLSGGEWKLADHRGQVVLINYWATWCEPCMEELPGLMRVARQSGPNGLAVVGISLDEGHDRDARVRQFVARYHVPYPVAFPDTTKNGDATVIGLPTTVLLDKQGRVAKTYLGSVEGDDFAKDIAALLSES